ncbi:MAG: ATP-dependent RecD-like DNA helicase [Anaerolineae bacterium]|nr:ATP-dependent RecD-like DNA helicase [Anaerolineae bacterium]
MPETLRGTVERITYANPETGYSVLRLAVKDKLDLETVVGNLADVNTGETLELEGSWIKHRQYGRQFQASGYRTVLPVTSQGIEKYLGSGLIKGIGPVMAERIVNVFDQDTLEVIEHEPQRLLDVPGIGRKRVAQIQAAWEEQKQIREVMIYLQSYGVRSSWAVKIYKVFGSAAVQVVQDDPYRLAREIHGIGFKTADKIARRLGLPIDSPKRIAAGVLYMLNEMAGEGHVYAPQDKLVAEAANMLQVEAELAQESLDKLEQEGQIHRETLPNATSNVQTDSEQDQAAGKETAVYLASLYDIEVGVAGMLRQILDHAPSRLNIAQGIMWEIVLTRQGDIHLSERQKQAVRAALGNKVTVLTGGPGTGKTTTVRTIIDVLEQFKCRYALASPTGRAAKRLAETAGRPAKTIHRLLGFVPGKGFAHDDDNPLDIDILIVDEASMLDLSLTHHLLKALHPATHLLLVGDIDQLPSVGEGNVLRDIIDCGQVPVVRLDLIFRQSAGSLIITNAHRINKGQMPLFDKPAADFFLFVLDDPDKAADMIVDIVQNRIPRKFGYDPLDDVQVLSPMYRGAVGVSNLNARLQAALNPLVPNKQERRLGERAFRSGDKVIQLRNNYDLDVYNGDVGRITKIDIVNQQLLVRMDNRTVAYDWSAADELALAFAISVHKSQGSEYPAVVVPVMTTHYVMLARNLLYTAVTRARQLVVLVGNHRALEIALANDQVAQRYSGLGARIAAADIAAARPPF